MSGLEIILKKIGVDFGKKVVERWTHWRAEKFFDGFTESLSNEITLGIQTEVTEQYLEKILDDDKKSEILFDAYRSVCFSKSKTLGPKIIGYLTGILISQGMDADENQEKIFQAAELLSDVDLKELFNEFNKQTKIASQDKDNSKGPHWVENALVIPWDEEVRDSAWPHTRESEIDVSPLNFDEVFGPWGGNVARIGLLTSRVTKREVEYSEDGERHIDEDGVLEIYSWTLTFEAPCRELCNLLGRCLGVTSNTY